MADDNYIRESIIDPAAKIVSGFQPIMPTFKGIVNEEGMLQLLAYIKSLNEQSGQPLNNRTSPTMLRDTEVPNIQQEMKDQSGTPQPRPEKKP